MSPKAIGRAIAGAFFVFWLAVLYAGADHPPPPGFLVVILLDLAAAVAVGFRVKDYLAWRAAGLKRRWLRVLLDGLAAGIIVAALVMLLPGGGEPTVRPRLVDRAAWFAILGAVGMANSAGVYTVGALLARAPSSLG